MIDGMSVDDVRRYIAVRRQQLDEMEKAVRVIEEVLRAGPSVGLFSFAHYGSFSTAVRDAALSFGRDNFAVPDVVNRLQTSGYEMPNRFVKERISTLLKDLRLKGVIELVSKGTGGRPHVYVAATTDEVPSTVDGCGIDVQEVL